MAVRAARPVMVGRLAVLVRGDDEEVVDRIDDLLASLPSVGDGDLGRRGAAWGTRLDAERDGAAVGRVVVDIVRGPAGFDLQVSGRSRACADGLDGIVDELLALCNRWHLDFAPDIVHLHAGLVSQGSHGALVLGPSGAGKSTLVVHLVRSGWSFHGDEAIGVDLGDATLLGYARPPTLKPGSWNRFRDLPSVAAALAAGDGRDRVHLPPAELGVLPTAERVRCALIVSLAGHGGVTAVRALSPLDAALRLIENTLDLGRASHDGVRALVALARSAVGVELEVGEPVDAERILGQLVAQRVAQVETEARWPVRTPSADQWPGDRRRAPKAVDGEPLLERRAWVEGFDFAAEGGFLHDRRTGAIVRLNPSGMQVWDSLATPGSARRIAERLRAELAPATVLGFLGELVELQIVGPLRVPASSGVSIG